MKLTLLISTALAVIPLVSAYAIANVDASATDINEVAETDYQDDLALAARAAPIKGIDCKTVTGPFKDACNVCKEKKMSSVVCAS